MAHTINNQYLKGEKYTWNINVTNHQLTLEICPSVLYFMNIKKIF